MELDEWLWKNRLTQKQVSLDTGIPMMTIGQIKRKMFVPNLITALKLQQYSDGAIKLTEMLPDKRRPEIDDYRKELEIRQKIREKFKEEK